MPGEEMEITTDFGHAGFGEDIDIDLDFAVGQADEDLELADFDQAQEMQNFNTDTRDELMAEGDDASYGMIDAEDAEPNEVATTVNDIEIDLGDPDENLWQQDAPQDAPQDVPPHGDTVDNVAEIDYIDANVENSTEVNVGGNGEDSWLEAPSYPINNTSEVELAHTDATALDATNNHMPRDSEVPAEGIDAQDFGVSETRDDTKALDVGGSGNDGSDNVVQVTINEQHHAVSDTSPQLSTEVPALEKDILQDDSNDAHSNGDASQGNAARDPLEDERDQARDNEAPETVQSQGDDIPEHQEDPSASVDSGHASANGNLDQHGNQIDQHDLSGPEASEQQLGEDSYAESTNDPQSVQSVGQEDDKVRVDETHSRTDYYDPEDEDHEAEDDDQDEQASRTGVAPAEHLLSIAMRHEMYISYGQTDYSLFAKSEDDDPNQYFLRDMSALELPLGQFLSSLREVIADEVSVLDELVMHVDGLGLEFSESSASDMLEEYTFGDILSLYDRLVENDDMDLAPVLYMYLMVRPNCHQRLMALLDSASAGRGLSEIAIYREPTPLPDEQADNSERHSPYATTEDGEDGETRHDSNPPTQGEEGEASYEYEDDLAGDETDAHDDDNEVEEHEGSKSPLGHALVAEVNAQDLEDPGETEKPEEIIEQAIEQGTGADIDKNAEVIDFSDDELDLSPSKQDHQANISRGDHDHAPGNESNDATTIERNELGQHTPPTELAEITNSEVTSATATLNGDDNDEIDYSDDDGEEPQAGQDNPSKLSDASTKLQVPVDDEITWESDNEDAKNETITTVPKATVQVSPSSGKRRRSSSDLLDGATGQNDVKRRRPS